MLQPGAPRVARLWLWLVAVSALHPSMPWWVKLFSDQMLTCWREMRDYNALENLKPPQKCFHMEFTDPMAEGSYQEKLEKE